MSKNIYIITGTSRGIGEAIARRLLKEGNSVYCISRNGNPRLTVEARAKGWDVQDLSLDLTQSGEIRGLIHSIFRDIDEDDAEEIVLINNAGVIHPIREIGGDNLDDAIVRNVTVNLVAAMLVTDAFIEETIDWECSRKIVNMSTGAARRPIAGWSAYCAAKAGLEMYARNIVLEQSEEENPIKVISFSPGVVDTEMQQEIRHAKAEDFPDLAKFRAFKNEGKLLNPGTVAETLIDIIRRDDFGHETLVSIRDILK
ncbi:MAG: (S)-benzoin forming benzil reductase [Bacteroidota bacterium]